MRDTIADIEQECCTGCHGEECGQECDCGDGYVGVDLRDSDTVELAERLEAARARWERDYQTELERLKKRVAELEEQQRAHASREICAAMTRITSFEVNVLGRDVTTSQAKKKGLEVLGVDGRSGPAVDKKAGP